MLKAVQTAFTKELAIIQGPPGTGKTYVGLKVAKVLLDNKDAWTKPDSSRPILVVCYTNHALDQFLEGILKFCPKGIVRVGGRSKSEALEAFNLKAIRANKRRDGEVDWSVCGSTINAYNAMKELGEKVEAASALGAALSRSVLNETVLQSSMLPGQYDSLTNTGPNAILPRSSSLMVDWLAFGNTLLGQDEESDPYTLLKREVTAHILDGTDIRSSPETDLIQNPRSVSYRVRAQMYRFWLKTMTDTLNMMMEAGKKKGRMKYSPKQLLEKSQKQILSDEELEPVNILEQLTGEREAPKTDRTEKEEEKKKDKNDDDTSVRDDRQLDDMDDDDFRHDQSSNIAFAIATFEPEESDQGREEGWTIPQSMRKKRIRQIQRSLQFEKAMTQEEAEAVTDVWDPNLTLKHRVQLYKFWLKKYQPRLKRSLKTDAEAFLQEAKLYEELKFAGDCEILREASVIGMTTTGAARYRKVLASVGCPIVMIEEAAEVLEAHVVTTLHESCQHLILIGDHQQLRPSPTVYELCRHYQLDLSLFERLVNNKLPHSTLAVQHRMRPEVARLQGYSPEQITILAAYTGQLLLIQSLMKQDDCYKGVYVAAVDNYQGEENDVIILSLEAKKKLAKATAVPKDRQEKLLTSMAKLYAAKKSGNFASAEEREKLEKTRLGANRVLALTVQTKLSRVTEIVLLHLSKLKSTGTASSSAHTDIDRLHKSAEKLQHVLLKPATAMTDQRCRELTTEARRLSYMALLHYAKVTITEKKEMTARRSLSTAYTALSRASPPGASRSGPDAEGQSEEDARLQRVDKFLGMLEDRNLSMVLTLEIEEFFEDCRRSDRNWSDAVDDTIFAILNAPFEKDLSDAEQQETRSTEDQKKEKEKLRQGKFRFVFYVM
nr:hypothetical protein BaRGS_017894 [Batillaria attramentaria]